MARITLSIDQADFDSAGQLFEPVPAGTYAVSIYEIGDGEVQTGENKGKPRLKFQFRIQDGETAPDGSKQGNRRLFCDINAFPGKDKKTGKATPPYDVIAIGKAIGLDADDLADIDTDDWLGKELQVSVTHEEKKTKESGYKDSFVPAQYRERVRGFRSLDSVGVSAAAGASAKASTGTKAKTFSL